MSLVKVENATHLVRDTSTGAVINTDSSALERHRVQRNAKIQAKSQIEQNTTDINNIKSELDDIKALLHTVLDKLSKG